VYTAAVRRKANENRGASEKSKNTRAKHSQSSEKDPSTVIRATIRQRVWVAQYRGLRALAISR
jgi:hypothetical protein